MATAASWTRKRTDGSGVSAGLAPSFCHIIARSLLACSSASGGGAELPDAATARRRLTDSCGAVVPRLCAYPWAVMGMAMQPKPASNSNLLALPDGTELVGDYRIKRVLGAGGFGITYLADEMALARLVTIKEYFPADFAARRGHHRCLAALAGLRRATTSGASTASSRKRRRSPASSTPTSCACTATSAPTTPATWCSTSRRAAASRPG